MDVVRYGEAFVAEITHDVLAELDRRLVDEILARDVGEVVGAFDGGLQWLVLEHAGDVQDLLHQLAVRIAGDLFRVGSALAALAVALAFRVSHLVCRRQKFVWAWQPTTFTHL